MQEPPIPQTFMPWPTTPWSHGEMEEFHNLQSLLLNAYSEVNRLRSSIALADYGFGRRRLLVDLMSKPEFDHRTEAQLEEGIISEWPVIAAYAAIGTIYHFHDTLDGIEEWCASATILDKLTDKATAYNVRAFLNKHFPKWEQTRHATAHASEIRRNPERNSFRGALSGGIVRKPKGPSLMMSDCFQNRTFITTRKGELLRFDVTWDSYKKLFDAYIMLLRGFSPAPARPEENRAARPQSRAR